MKNNNQFVFEYNTKTNSYTFTLGAVESKITEIDIPAVYNDGRHGEHQVVKIGRKYTSAEVGKLLKKLNDERASILLREENGKEFLAAVGEDIESVRPDYYFKETQNALDEIETKMRKLKHALNVFNSTTVIPEFGMTIDEMLVYIPQLTMRKNKLARMKDRLPKAREQTRVNSSILDYRYLNYGVDEATAEYDKIADTLARAQNALDAVNMSEILEVEL